MCVYGITLLEFWFNRVEQENERKQTSDIFINNIFMNSLFLFLKKYSSILVSMILSRICELSYLLHWNSSRILEKFLVFVNDVCKLNVHLSVS